MNLPTTPSLSHGSKTCITLGENGKRRDTPRSLHLNCASTHYMGRWHNGSDGTKKQKSPLPGINLSGPDGSPLIVVQCSGTSCVKFRIDPSLRWRLTDSTPQQTPQNWVSITLAN